MNKQSNDDAEETIEIDAESEKETKPKPKVEKIDFGGKLSIENLLF